MRIAELIDREAGEREHPQRRQPRRAQLVLDALRAGEPLRAHHARAPGRRRARLARRDAAGALRDGQGRRLVPVAPTSSRCPTSTASSSCRSSSPRCRTTSTSARSCSSTAATSTATRPTRSSTAPRDPQHRPPPRQHALRHDRPRRAGRVVHGRGDLGPDARPRRRADAADRRGALRRPRHRHGPVHVREHRLARARDGRRADRRRDRRARDLPAPLRGRAAGQARAARARAEPRSSASTAGCSPSRSSRARTTRPRAPTRATPRAWSTTCARSRARRSPASCATCSPTARATRRKVSLRATDDRVDVSRIARAQGGGGHRRAAGFSTDLEFPELVAFLRARARRAAVELRRDRPSTRRGTDGVLLVDKPAGVTSHDVVADERRGLRPRDEGRPRRHARPVRDRAAARAVGRATRVQRFLMALPKRYEVRRAARLDVDDRRPRGRDRAGRGRPPSRSRCRRACCASARPPTRR